MDAIEEKLTMDLARSAEAAETAGLAPPDIDEVRASVERRRHRRRTRAGLLVAAAAMVVAGTAVALTAGNEPRTEIGNDPAPATGPPTTTAPSTTETTTLPTTASTTSTPTTTTSAPTPAPGRVAESIPLRALAIGSFPFRSADAATVRAAITAELGPPLSEVPPLEAPVPPCSGDRIDPEPSWLVSSEVVWPGLVVWFAGPDAETQYLVGYQASNRASTSSTDASPTVRMAEGPALTDPLETWQAFYGPAMVDRYPGGPGTDRTFNLQLADGQVVAQDYPPTGGTARYWGVHAGLSCGSG